MESGGANEGNAGEPSSVQANTTKVTRKRKSERIIKAKLGKRVGGDNDEGNCSNNAVNLD